MDLAEKHEGDQAVLSRKYGDSLRTIESQKRRIESLVSQMGGLIAAEEEFSQQDPEVGAAQADSIQAQVHELQEQLQRAALAAAINCGRQGCNPPTRAELGLQD